MRRLVHEFLQHACPVTTALTHAENAAGTDVDPCTADMIERLEAVLECACRNDIAVELGRGIQVVVVVVESGFLEALCLRPGQHAKRHAGLHAEIAHGPDHFDHLVEISVGRVAPGRPHAEASRAFRFRNLCRLDDLLDRQQLFAFQRGIVLRALGAVATILGARARLDTQQGTDLDLVGIEVRAMDLLCFKQQVVERLVEQGFDLPGLPVVADSTHVSLLWMTVSSQVSLLIFMRS